MNFEKGSGEETSFGIDSSRGTVGGIFFALNVSCVKETTRVFLKLVYALEDFVNAFTSTTSSLPAFNNNFVVSI